MSLEVPVKNPAKNVYPITKLNEDLVSSSKTVVKDLFRTYAHNYLVWNLDQIDKLHKINVKIKELKDMWVEIDSDWKKIDFADYINEKIRDSFADDQKKAAFSSRILDLQQSVNELNKSISDSHIAERQLQELKKLF